MPTKADLLRAIVRTAALTHWRHNFKRVCTPANDLNPRHASEVFHV